MELNNPLNLKSTQNQRVTRFICEICDKEFTTNTGFEQHKKLYNGPKQPKCNSLKQYKSSYDCRMQSMCNKKTDKHFTCDICEKTFSSSIRLNEHKRLYKGAKLQYCIFCVKKFHDKVTLARHKSKCKKNTDPGVSSWKVYKKSYTMRPEDIKEEENDDDPLSFNQETENCNSCKDIKTEIKVEESYDHPHLLFRDDTIQGGVTEVKEEVIDDEFLCVEEIHNSEDGDTNIVVDGNDIAEH